EALVIEMLEDNYHTAPIEGIGIVNDKAAYFIPTEIALKSEAFSEWAENKNNTKFVFDAKRTVVALLNNGIHLKGITFDMLLAYYLLNPSENHHDIPAVGQRYGKKNVLFDEEVYGKGAKASVPEQDDLSEHIVRKTVVLYTLKAEMEQQLEDNEQYQLFKELEMTLALKIEEIEHTEVIVNETHWEEMGSELRFR